MKKNIFPFVLGALFVLIAGITYAISHGQKTLRVTEAPSFSVLLSNYVLYVPGEKSTCTWTYKVNGEAQTTVTEEAGVNAKHSLSHPKDGGSWAQPQVYSDFRVSCLSDNGKTYRGTFP